MPPISNQAIQTLDQIFRLYGVLNEHEARELLQGNGQGPRAVFQNTFDTFDDNRIDGRDNITLLRDIIYGDLNNVDINTRARYEQIRNQLLRTLSAQDLRAAPQNLAANFRADPLVDNPYILMDGAREHVDNRLWSDMRHNYSGQTVNFSTANSLNLAHEALRLQGVNQNAPQADRIRALVKEFWTNRDGSGKHVFRMEELHSVLAYMKSLNLGAQGEKDFKNAFFQEMGAYISDRNNGLDSQFVMNSLISVLQSSDWSDPSSHELKNFVTELAMGNSANGISGLADTVPAFAGNNKVIGNYDGSVHDGNYNNTDYGALALVRNQNGQLELIEHRTASQVIKTRYVIDGAQAGQGNQIADQVENIRNRVRNIRQRLGQPPGAPAPGAPAPGAPAPGAPAPGAPAPGAPAPGGVGPGGPQGPAQAAPLPNFNVNANNLNDILRNLQIIEDAINQLVGDLRAGGLDNAAIIRRLEAIARAMELTADQMQQNLNRPDEVRELREAADQIRAIADSLRAPAGQPPAGQPPAAQPPAGQPPAGQPLVQPPPATRSGRSGLQHRERGLIGDDEVSGSPRPPTPQPPVVQPPPRMPRADEEVPPPAAQPPPRMPRADEEVPPPAAQPPPRMPRADEGQPPVVQPPPRMPMADEEVPPPAAQPPPGGMGPGAPQGPAQNQAISNFRQAVQAGRIPQQFDVTADNVAQLETEYALLAQNGINNNWNNQQKANAQEYLMRLSGAIARYHLRAPTPNIAQATTYSDHSMRHGEEAARLLAPPVAPPPAAAPPAAAPPAAGQGYQLPIAAQIDTRALIDNIKNANITLVAPTITADNLDVARGGPNTQGHVNRILQVVIDNSNDGTLNNAQTVRGLGLVRDYASNLARYFQDRNDARTAGSYTQMASALEERIQAINRGNP